MRTKGTSKQDGLTPMKAIRKYCLECCKGSFEEIRECTAKKCPLWPIRDGKRPKGTKPLKTIKAKCLDCSGGERSEIKNCKHTDCPLWSLRSGKRAGKDTPQGVPTKI